MSNNVRTAKLSTLIENLQEILDNEGDLPIVASADEEGNNFNTFDAQGDNTYTVENGLLVLYPSSERNELDEIEGFVEDVDDDYDDYDDDNPFDDYDIDKDYD
jgi:hypothetical protein